MFDSTVIGMQNAQTDLAVPMAVTSQTRSRIAAHVPALKELGINVNFSVWQGMFVANDVSRDLVLTLNSTLRSALRQPTTQQRFIQMGVENILDLTVDQAEASITTQKSQIDSAFSNIH